MLPDLTGRARFYILQGRTVVPVATMAAWASWHAHTPRATVDHTECNGVAVTTVFHGIDTRLTPTGEPPVFETYLTPADADDATRGLTATASTWNEAEANHLRAVNRLRYPLAPTAGARGNARRSWVTTRLAWHRAAGFFFSRRSRNKS